MDETESYVTASAPGSISSQQKHCHASKMQRVASFSELKTAHSWGTCRRRGGVQILGRKKRFSSKDEAWQHLIKKKKNRGRAVIFWQQEEEQGTVEKLYK